MTGLEVLLLALLFGGRAKRPSRRRPRALTALLCPKPRKKQSRQEANARSAMRRYMRGGG